MVLQEGGTYACPHECTHRRVSGELAVWHGHEWDSHSLGSLYRQFILHIIETPARRRLSVYNTIYKMNHKHNIAFFLIVYRTRKFESSAPRRFPKYSLIKPDVLTVSSLSKVWDEVWFFCGLCTHVVNCFSFPNLDAPMGSQGCQEETTPTRTQLSTALAALKNRSTKRLPLS